MSLFCNLTCTVSPRIAFACHGPLLSVWFCEGTERCQPFLLVSGERDIKLVFLCPSAVHRVRAQFELVGSHSGGAGGLLPAPVWLVRWEPPHLFYPNIKTLFLSAWLGHEVGRLYLVPFYVSSLRFYFGQIASVSQCPGPGCTFRVRTHRKSVR